VPEATVPRNLMRGAEVAVIDFRARPNTVEYMRNYTGAAHARLWERFGYPEPPTVELDEFLATLDACGVDLGVFTGRQMMQDGKLVKGVTNDYVADVVAASNGKLIGFAGIDPATAGSGTVEVERAIRQLGLRGISLDPQNRQATPADRSFYPVYAKAVELDVPVVFTMGPLVGRYADPADVDIVAEDFPDLTIVCSHGCWPQVTEFIALAYRRMNVYLEASIYEFLPGAEPFLDAARTILQDRVVYASAFPFNPIDTISRFSELGFASDVLEKLVYGNAARVLGLDASLD
jgi:uncharacterized protein